MQVPDIIDTFNRTLKLSSNHYSFRNCLYSMKVCVVGCEADNSATFALQLQ